MLMACVSFGSTASAQDMSKDEWQNQMNQLITKRNDLKNRLDRLNADIGSIKTQSTKLDADLAACEEELLKLQGATREQYNAFEKEIGQYEMRVDALMRMSDADLMQYSDEVAKMGKRVDEMTDSKIGKIPRFASRLSALKSKIQSLMSTMAKGGNTYTVGTWAKDRDCLWNIAKKPATYGNAWMWPKIWQGNKDKIQDPDVIKPGWKLNIPGGKELTNEEKSAANSYYKKKAGR